jgi:TolB-like protein
MKVIIYRVLAVWLAGCNLAACNSAALPREVVKQPALSEYPLHYYTQQLADRLFAQVPAQSTLARPAAEIAVASFLPVNSLSLAEADDVQKQLANQLSESMLTHARQRGFVVYDYRLRGQLLLQADHEQALSRQLADIGNLSDADTLLVGTYTVMEDGMLLNARLISIRNKQVLAAASGYVPHNVLWSRQQVGKRGDKLYRQRYSGEQR